LNYTRANCKRSDRCPHRRFLPKPAIT